MAEQTKQSRGHGSAGLTPTRLEVTESLRAVDRENIDQILATPADALDRLDAPAVPVQPEELESPEGADTLRAQVEDELDHIGLEEEESPAVTPAVPQATEEPKEHRDVRWGVV